MVRHIDVVFSQGAFRPVERVAVRDGTWVRLRIEEETDAGPASRWAKIHTPKLENPEEAGDFVMEVRENGDVGVWCAIRSAGAAIALRYWPWPLFPVRRLAR